MRSQRAALGVAGVLVGLWGVWKLVLRGLPDVTTVALWFAGGVIGHDALLVPLTIAAGLLARLLPRPWRAPTAVGALVLGSVTLLAVPVLGRFGAHPDNPTLLDRNYLVGWAALAALTAAVVLLTGWRRRALDVAEARRRAVPSRAAPRSAGRIGDP